jgi:hypothetical protein
LVGPIVLLLNMQAGYAVGEIGVSENRELQIRLVRSD